jgi:signal transduction histidine kinase
VAGEVEPTSAIDLSAGRVLAALPTAVLLLDAQLAIVYANPRAERILGSLAGRFFFEFVHPLPDIFTSHTPGAVATNLRATTPVTLLQIGYSVAALSTEGPGDPCYAVVFQDIGPIEKLKEERDRLLQLAAVGDTLPAVLHEIKNPLAGITTAVEVLMEELDEGPVRRELTAVLSEVRRIKLALEGIGLFRSVIRTPRKQAVDRALREAFLVIEPQIRGKGLEGIARIANMPLLPLDAAAIRALLFNLVTNSIHASEPGGRIEVLADLVDKGSVLELTVTDTGAGMTPEVLALCRELFFTTKPNGSGIGLALCSQVVEKAGGTVVIDSHPGGGTMVRLRIPAAIPEE